MTVTVKVERTLIGQESCQCDLVWCGHEKPCAECDGAGYSECDLGHEHDCEDCDGTGKVDAAGRVCAKKEIPSLRTVVLVDSTAVRMCEICSRSYEVNWARYRRDQVRAEIASGQMVLGETEPDRASGDTHRRQT